VTDIPVSNDGTRKVYAVVVTKEKVVGHKSDYGYFIKKLRITNRGMIK
jgi:hypothetical protein